MHQSQHIYTGPICKDLIQRGAQAYPNNIAVTYDDKSLTFSEVDELSSRIANYLLSEGVAPRSKIGILSDNSLYTLPIDFCTAKAAYNRIPLNPRLSTDEHIHMLDSVDCNILLYNSQLQDEAERIALAIKELRLYVIDDDGGSTQSLIDSAYDCHSECPKVDVHHDDVLMTLFTSGTTGTLKAAQHTQATYANIARNILTNLVSFNSSDVMLHAASMIHASGTLIVPAWVRGAQALVMHKFVPSDYLRLIEEKKATVLNLVPTMIQMLLEEPTIESSNLSSVRALIYGASPMPEPVLKKAQEIFGKDTLIQYYGQTELPLSITVLKPEEHTEKRALSCGKPSVDVEVRIVDNEGGDVPVGDVGELWVRGGAGAIGYYDAPELTASTFDRDGWIHTRDLGYFDEEGYIYLKDRTSNMIISGGYNVYPREIEDCLLGHPAIAECAVFGIPDKKWVETVNATVVLRKGGNASEEELFDYLIDRVAKYKQPKRIIFVDVLPKTAVGKVNHKQLRDDYKHLAN